MLRNARKRLCFLHANPPSRDRCPQRVQGQVQKQVCADVNKTGGALEEPCKTTRRNTPTRRGRVGRVSYCPLRPTRRQRGGFSRPVVEYRPRPRNEIKDGHEKIPCPPLIVNHAIPFDSQSVKLLYKPASSNAFIIPAGEVSLTLTHSKNATIIYKLHDPSPLCSWYS